MTGKLKELPSRSVIVLRFAMSKFTVILLGQKIMSKGFRQVIAFTTNSAEYTWYQYPGTVDAGVAVKKNKKIEYLINAGVAVALFLSIISLVPHPHLRTNFGRILH